MLRLVSASLLATLLLPALAFAQPDPAAQPQPAQPAQPAQPPVDPALAEQARARFMQGRTLAEAGDCSGAIVEFEASYRIVPRPGTLFNIAQCQERLFRYDLAIEGYQRYLDSAPPDAEDRGAVQAAMGTLRNLLGTITITSNVPAEVWIDDHLAGNAPGDVLIPGGRHSVELRAERYIPSQDEVTVSARETITLEVTLRRAERRITIREETGLDPWIFWAGVAGTVVLTGIGSIFGVQALSLRDSAESMNPLLPRDAIKQDIEDTALLADIFFGSAFVVAVGTGIVFFLTDWNDEAPRVTEETPPEEQTPPPAPPHGCGPPSRCRRSVSSSRATSDARHALPGHPGDPPGCSLLGLSEGLDAQRCDSDAVCAPLNDDMATRTGDPCRTWQCGTDRLCNIAPFDADGDGFSPPECTPLGMTPDCDDANPAAFPQDSEPAGVCDGVDNDCDGFPDDGSFGPMDPTLLASGAASDTSYAVRPGEAGVTVTFTGTMSRPFVLPIAGPRAGGATQLPAVPVTFDLAAGSRVPRGRIGTVSRGSALAALPTAGEFAFAYVESSGCQRPLLGRMRTPAMPIQRTDTMMETGFLVDIDVTHYERGFADDMGLHCDRTPCSPHVECRERMPAAGGGLTQECEGTTCLQPCTRDNMCEDRAPIGGMRGPEDEQCVCPPCAVTERFCMLPTRACMPGMIRPAGETCILGNCRLPCVDDLGCPRAGDSCVCRTPCVDTEKHCEDPRGTCEPNTLCPAGETCEPDSIEETVFHCQRPCTMDSECPDAGETCDTVMGRCVSSGRNLGARMISVGTVDRAIVVAYARDSTMSRDACPAPPVGLRLSFGYRSSTPTASPPIVVVPGPALPLGTTEDTGAPAILGIPGFGFIVAFADEADNIVFRHITIETMAGGGGPYTFTLEPEPLLTIPPEAAPAVDDENRGHVALAIGETTGTDVITLGLAYRSDCAIDSDTFVRLLQLNTATGTLTTASQSAQVPPLDNRRTEEHPTIAFNGETDTWLVAAEIASETVEGRRFVLREGGELFFPPEDPYILLPATEDQDVNVSQAPFAFPTTTTFGIVAHLTRDDDNTPGFYGSDLLCLMEGGPTPDAGTPDAGM